MIATGDWLGGTLAPEYSREYGDLPNTTCRFGSHHAFGANFRREAFERHDGRDPLLRGLRLSYESNSHRKICQPRPLLPQPPIAHLSSVLVRCDFHYHNWGDHPFGLLQGGRQQHLGLLRKREFVGDSLCGHGQHFVVRLSHWPPARFTGLCRCHLFCCREARALFQSNAVRPAGLDASRRARVLSFGTLCTAL